MTRGHADGSSTKRGDLGRSLRTSAPHTMQREIFVTEMTQSDFHHDRAQGVSTVDGVSPSGGLPAFAPMQEARPVSSQRAARTSPAGDLPVKDIVVLCYHAVSETWPTNIAVTPKRLDAQLSDFLRRGYRGMTLSDALTAPRHSRTLVVTFDDAFRSVLNLALPILRRLELPGTVYVPTAYPGTEVPMAWKGYDQWVGTPHEHELACLSWGQLRALHALGWEIGSHTDSHPRLTTLDDASLMRELHTSRAKCESEMDAPCLSFAYPYSDHDARVVEATRKAGYLLGTTVPFRSTPPLPLQWPRVVVGRKDSARQVRIRAWRRATPSLDAAWWSVRPAVLRAGAETARVLHRHE
jgi:peptidoglycan/xylan/chitin deacetylase (PgdA/CDA1 family)